VNCAALAVRVPPGHRVAIDERALVPLKASAALRKRFTSTRTSAGGHVVVVRSERQEGSVLIDVIDNAGGIAEPLRRDLFEPFVGTRSGRDTGLHLGLAVSRAMVREAGGELELLRSDATETVFRCTLPAAA
jgi:C4-dicarboxylate-specific signal transduction histidine kinase